MDGKRETWLQYQVAMPCPQNHLFEVTLTIQEWTEPQLNLQMPVWTPGSYLVREYSRHLQNFEAIAGDGRALSWRKLAKHHWQVDCQEYPQAGAAESTEKDAAQATSPMAAASGDASQPLGRSPQPVTISPITIKYRIFAHELTVRTNHLDATHGYFNGAAMFFFIPGYEQRAIAVTIVLPEPAVLPQSSPAWQVATALPQTGEHTYLAQNFDTLVDSPFEIGIHQRYEFAAAGKPHALVVWGQGNLQPQPLLADMQKIIEVEAALFGGLPYERYLFLLHLSPQGFGGLEHRDSCSLIYQQFGFRKSESYHRFMQLVAHEFFHLWNVKRIRPKGLEQFDYTQENYTPSLWFSEGTTSFYDLMLPLRAGIYDARVYLAALSQEITRFLNTPGRLVQPLAESSFDAWIKLYRPDANSPNSQISYYLKGEMVSLLLDLGLRAKFANQRSLDQVVRQLWKAFGQTEIGFTEADLWQILEAVAEEDFSEFRQRYLETTVELPFEPYLNLFGLTLQAEAPNTTVWVGWTVKTEAGQEQVKTVETNSPAQLAGIEPGDQLLALNGIRASAAQLNERLSDYQPGDRLEVTVFHLDQLCQRWVTLAEPRAQQFRIVPVANPTEAQAQLFSGWLGCSLESLQGCGKLTT